jgi:hypothetical protein
VTAVTSKTLEPDLRSIAGAPIAPENYLTLPPKHTAAENSRCIAASILPAPKGNFPLHAKSINGAIPPTLNAAAGSIEQSPTQPSFRINFYETVSFLILGKRHGCFAQGGKVTIAIGLPCGFAACACR